MKTSSFETAFIEALENHIKSSHSDLQLTIPSAGNYFDQTWTSYTPDVIVKNKKSGKFLVIEVSGGGRSNTTPYAVFSKITALKHQLESIDKPLSMILVSNAGISESMRGLLDEEKIELAQAETVQQAIRAVESSLAKIDPPQDSE